MNFRVVTKRLFDHNTLSCFISYIYRRDSYRQVLKKRWSVQTIWSSLYSGTNHSRALNHWLEWLGERFRMGGMKKREKSVERGVFPSTKDSFHSFFSESDIVFHCSMETTFWTVSLRTVALELEKTFLLRGKLSFFLNPDLFLNPGLKKKIFFKPRSPPPDGGSFPNLTDSHINDQQAFTETAVAHFLSFPFINTLEHSVCSLLLSSTWSTGTMHQASQLFQHQLWDLFRELPIWWLSNHSVLFILNISTA